MISTCAKQLRARRKWKPVVLGLIFIVLTAVFVQRIPAQCEVHPDKKTSVRFSNESKFELTFFVDEDEKGLVVPERTASVELYVEPGDHLFRARAIINGVSVWVWAVNEVAAGQLCTWTVDGPENQDAACRIIYGTTLAAGPTHKKFETGKNKAIQIHKDNGKEKYHVGY